MYDPTRELSRAFVTVQLPANLDIDKKGHAFCAVGCSGEAFLETIAEVASGRRAAGWFDPFMTEGRLSFRLLAGLVAHLPAPVSPQHWTGMRQDGRRAASGPELPWVQIMSSLADESATTEVTIATGNLPGLFAWDSHNPLRKSVSYSCIYINIMLPKSI
jgi:hypothetical protein